VAETVATRIARLAQMSTADLRREWQAVMGEEPRSYNRQWMYKRLCWHLQVQEHGGLSKRAKERLEELLPLAPQWLPMPRSFKPAVPQATVTKELQPGTVITRVYKGRTLVVTVREDGFEFDGVVYPSLTAVAKAVTGSHWNGHLFFFGPKTKRRTG